MASKRHLLVGQLLDNIPLTKNMRKDEEVIVRNIAPDFPDGRKRFDWVIKDLKLVIEVMGEQHTKPIAFGHRGDAKEQFAKQVRHDIDKQLAALKSGYSYFEVPYWVKLDEDWLLKAILEATEDKENTNVSKRISDINDKQSCSRNIKKPSTRIRSKCFPKKDTSTLQWKQNLKKETNYEED